MKAISATDCWFLPSSRVLPARPAETTLRTTSLSARVFRPVASQQGVDLLLESLSRLAEEDWHRTHESVRICGGGPLEELVQERCNTMERAGRPVKMMGT